MLGDCDLTQSHEIERIRRSVAMLTPGASALGLDDTARVRAAIEGHGAEAPADEEYHREVAMRALKQLQRLASASSS